MIFVVPFIVLCVAFMHFFGIALTKRNVNSLKNDFEYNVTFIFDYEMYFDKLTVIFLSNKAFFMVGWSVFNIF